MSFKSSVPNSATAYNTLPINLTSGRKYRFSAWYFLKSDTPQQCSLSGRIVIRFNEANSKNKYHFPVFEIIANRWIQVEKEFFAPPGLKDALFTLWFSGEGILNWDDIEVKEINEREVNSRFNWNCNLVQNEEILIWKASPNLKIDRQIVPSLSSDTIKISCARNESEPFQLVIKPKQELKNVSLKFSDLRQGDNILPSSCVSYNPVGFIYVKTSSNPNIIGWNADPLLNQQTMSCNADKNQPFWIKVKVPENALPGIYTGEVLVNSNNKTIYTIPYRVQVRNFAIPTIPFLQTAFYTRFFPTQMGQFDNRPWEIQMRDAYEQLQSHRITGNQGVAPPLPGYTINNAKLNITDWTAFDSFIHEQTTLYGIRWLRLPSLGWFGTTDELKESRWISQDAFLGHSVISPDGLNLLQQYTKAISEHMKGKEGFSYMNSYIWDEPHTEPVITAVNKISTAIKKGCPEMKIFVTSRVRSDLKNIDTWCVPMSPGHFNAELQEKAIENGQELWFYNWLVRLDKPSYIQNRLFAWQIYASKGSGGLLWATLYTRAGANPWDEINRTYDNGAATLMYPPRGIEEKLCSSQRFALIKESIDDFDYMKILEQRINRDFPEAGSHRVREILNSLIIKNPFKYENDPSLLYALRNVLADEIEQCDQHPKVLVKSVPQDNSHITSNYVTLYGICPKGAQVTINNQKSFIAKDGEFTSVVILNKRGNNTVKISIKKDGKTKHIKRYFTLLDDSNIKRLEDLIVLSDKLKINNISAKELINKVRNIKKYGEAESSQVEEMCFQLEKLCLQQEISALPDNTGVIKKYFIERARWAFQTDLIERCKYYLEAYRKAPDMPNNTSVSLLPCRIDGHQAFIIKNDLVEITILESGGRILSFKVKGIECFKQNDLKKDYPEIDRARKLVSKLDDKAKPILGGFEDAGLELEVWSNADWDISFPEVSPNKITMAAEFITPDKKFRIRRLMTLNENDPRLGLSYSIANITPEEFATDDPALNSYNWRGWTCCAINGDPEGDKLVVPGSPAKFSPLYSCKAPENFCNRAIPLSENFVGAYDLQSQTGFGFILPPSIKHVMVWFNSKNNQGYTIEPHRSNVAAITDPNATAKPFQIKPGEEVLFNIYMIGLSNIKDDQQFSNELRKWQDEK